MLQQLEQAIYQVSRTLVFRPAVCQVPVPCIHLVPCTVVFLGAMVTCCSTYYFSRLSNATGSTSTRTQSWAIWYICPLGVPGTIPSFNSADEMGRANACLPLCHGRLSNCWKTT